MSKKNDPLFGSAKDIVLSDKEMQRMWRSLQKFMQKHPVRIAPLKRPITRMKRVSSFKIGKGAELSQSEKDAVFFQLRAHMRAYPIGSQKRTFFSVFHTFFTMHQFASGALAVLLLIGAGAAVSSAAESALPDSFLYSIKVNVNEPIVEALTLDPEEKAQVQIRHMQRRFEEAKAMNAVQELDTSESEKIEQSIGVFMDRIEQKIVELDTSKSKGADNLARQYRNVLLMQESALKALSNENVTQARMDQIIQQVKSARQRFESPEERVERIKAATRSLNSSSSVNSASVELQNRVETRQEERLKNRTSQGNNVHVESTNSVEIHTESRTENSVRVHQE